jgi:hypothetical protein
MEAARPERGRSSSLSLAALLAVLLAATSWQQAGASTVLSKGVTRNGVVSGNASKFYKLQLSCPDAAASLLLTLTPLQGDPDLYVSTTIQQPGPVNGADEVLLGNATQLLMPYPSAGMYYLGVTSAASAAFKVQATVQLATGACVAHVSCTQTRAGRVRIRDPLRGVLTPPTSAPTHAAVPNRQFTVPGVPSL